MKTRLSRGFAVLVTLIVGTGIWLAIGHSVCTDKTAADIALHAESISNAISTFAMALIALMASAVAVATALRNGFWIKQFRTSGGMKEYLFYYAFTIVCLFITHLLAVYALVNSAWFRMTLSSAVLNTLQVLWVMYGAHRIAEQATTKS